MGLQAGASLAAGAQSRQQLQSGSGPLTIEVRLSSTLLCKIAFDSEQMELSFDAARLHSMEPHIVTTACSLR